jgi:hypothetical protein
MRYQRDIDLNQNELKNSVIHRTTNETLLVPIEGQIVYNTDLKCLRVWNGTSWDNLVRESSVPFHYLIVLQNFFDHISKSFIDTEKKIFATHGDLIDKHFNNSIITARIPDLILYYLSKIIRIDLRTVLHSCVKWYYNNIMKYMEKFYAATSDNYKLYILGHTHIPSLIEKDNKIFLNLGCWYGDYTYAAFIRGNKFAYIKITEDYIEPQEEDFKEFI